MDTDLWKRAKRPRGFHAAGLMVLATAMLMLLLCSRNLRDASNVAGRRPVFSGGASSSAATGSTHTQQGGSQAGHQQHHDAVALADQQEPLHQANQVTAEASPTAGTLDTDTPAWPASLLPPSDWTFHGVTPPRRVEGDIELVPRCNASFVSQHPLSIADYARSFTMGNPCSMPPGLLGRLQSGDPVRVTVVGGSMTRGNQCHDGKRVWRECAWSSRLQDRLQEVFPQGNITVVNAALSGFSYSHWVRQGLLDGIAAQSDVVVVDEQVNSHQYGFDAYKQMEEADVFLYSLLEAAHRQQRHLGVLFMETFRTCASDGAACDVSCGKMEAGRQGAMNFTVSGHNVTWRFCQRWWTYPDMERPVVRHYNLPVASYRDAVWPILSKPRRDLPCLWNGKSHPDAISHTIIGDVMAYGLIRAALASSTAAADTCAAHASQAPQRFHPHLELFQYCRVHDLQGSAGPEGGPSRGTFMSVYAPSTFQPVRSGSWLWREDVPGRPGWIYDPLLTPVNASSVDEQKLDPGAQPVAATDADVIWFKVFFSDKPQLQLTYLVSYERMGFVELTIHKADDVQAFDNSTALQAYPIDGSHTDAISVPKTSVFVHLTASSSIRTKAMAVGLPKAVGQGEYMVALRPQPLPKKDKFKLLGITSC